MTRQLERNSFYLSLLIHGLLLLPYFLFWQAWFPIEKKPALYIPSYVAPKPLLVSDSTRSTAPAAMRRVETSEFGIDKPIVARLVRGALANSATARSENSQQVQMVGDKKVDKPLIKLLGQALAAHLIYPKSAVDFRLRGTTLVGFHLHPDGMVTDVQVVRTSGAEVLDRAAVAAAEAMSPVKAVSQFVPQTRFLVAGIIFG